MSRTGFTGSIWRLSVRGCITTSGKNMMPTRRNRSPGVIFSGGFEGDVIKDILIGRTVTPVTLLQTANAQRTGSYQTASVYLEPVRNLENLLRILKSVAASDEVVNMNEETGEDAILMEIADYLKSRNSGRITWVTETADGQGNLVIVLNDRLKSTAIAGPWWRMS